MQRLHDDHTHRREPDDADNKAFADLGPTALFEAGYALYLLLLVVTVVPLVGLFWVLKTWLG